MHISQLVDENLTRSRDVRPFGKKFAIGREELNATVFTIGHVNRPLPIHRDAVRHVKLAGATSGLAPREDQPAIYRELVNTRVAITIADVNLVRGGERHVGWVMERRP